MIPSSESPSVPSAIPTIIPTRVPSLVPNSVATLVPSSVPSTLSSSAIPSSLLSTTEPTGAPFQSTSARVVFTADVIADNITSAATTDEPSLTALRSTVQDAVAGIPLDDVAILQMTVVTSSSSMLNTNRVSAANTAFSYSVRYEINTIFTALGFATAADAYKYMSLDISNSVSSATFSTNLINNAKALGAFPLYNSSVPSNQIVAFSNFTVTDGLGGDSRENTVIGWGKVSFIIVMSAATVFLVGFAVRSQILFNLNFQNSKHQVNSQKSSTVAQEIKNSSSGDSDGSRLTFSKQQTPVLNVMHFEKRHLSSDNCL